MFFCVRNMRGDKGVTGTIESVPKPLSPLFLVHKSLSGGYASIKLACKDA